MSVIPASWLTKVPMKRVILHWTAGAYTPNSTDLKAYHFVVDGDGKWHRGVDVAKNSGSLKSGYAAHTLNCNTGSIGVSLACMAGAVESPFNAGKYPMKAVQVSSLVAGLRELLPVYSIPVGPKTVLSHAEVQGTLGIAQRQKWDYTRLPFNDDLRGATAIGNWIRERVSSTLDSPPVAVREPFPAGAVLEAVVSTVTSSGQVSGAAGSIPKGTVVTMLDERGDRVQVRTPGGFTVWAPSVAFRLLGVVDKENDAPGSSTRELISDIRAKLDQLEQLINNP